MTSEKHTDAFLARLLDMLRHKAESEAEAEEMTDKETHPSRKRQRPLPARMTLRRRRVTR